MSTNTVKRLAYIKKKKFEICLRIRSLRGVLRVPLIHSCVSMFGLKVRLKLSFWDFSLGKIPYTVKVGLHSGVDTELYLQNYYLQAEEGSLFLDLHHYAEHLQKK